MSTLFETKYPNNSRVVSGTVTLYKDDVILLCDTSVAPVTINLFEIPDNYWSTQWKLYIIDNSNNASVNNITINAGLGQTINTSSSLVLTTNGSTALIRIVSNEDYIATLGSASSGYNLIKNEGIALPQRTTIDFLGEFVNASDSGTETQVTVNPIIKEVTSLQLNTLISSNSLIKGLLYKVIDTPYLLNITLLAIDTNEVSLEGDGLLYVADYQNLGDYSGVVGFNSQLGLWNGALTPIAGDVVIWNNKHWLNLTGVNTSTYPNLDNINWSELVKSTTKGYLIEAVRSEYNPQTNVVLRIKDLRLNEVEFAINNTENSLLNFPFGNDVFKGNRFEGSSLLLPQIRLGNVPFKEFYNNVIVNSEIGLQIDLTVDVSNIDIYVINNLLYNTSQMLVKTSDVLNTVSLTFSGNFLMGGSLEVWNIPNYFGSSIFVNSNTLYQSGSAVFVLNSAPSTIIGGNTLTFNSNTVNEGGTLYCTNIDSAFSTKSISFNQLIQSSSVTFSLNLSANFIGNRIYKSVPITLGLLSDNLINGIDCILSEEESTFGIELDLSDITVYNPSSFILNLQANEWAGKFYLTNGSGGNITKITNRISSTPITLIAKSGLGVLAFTLTYVAIGGALASEIVTNTSLVTKTNFREQLRAERVMLNFTNSIWFVKETENWT